jgi:hypothetical protein
MQSTIYWLTSMLNLKNKDCQLQTMIICRQFLPPRRIVFALPAVSTLPNMLNLNAGSFHRAVEIAGI